MGVEKFSFYHEKATELIERDLALRQMQAAMDRMSHLEYSLPAALSEIQWMRNYRTTAPYDALRGGTRALARLEEQLQIEPVTVLGTLSGDYDDDSAKARETANAWETCLRWNMRRAAARTKVKLRSDVIRSSLLYDETCAHIVHLPTQLKVMADLKGNTARYKTAMRHGPFAVNLRNPQQVHVEYSDYMAEAVLSVRKLTPDQVLEIWGDAAGKIRTIEEGKLPDYYLLLDYSGLDKGRCVWAAPCEEEDQLESFKAESDDIIHIVEPVKLPYPFLPWACAVGGTALDDAPDHQRLPLLYPIYRSELWLNANVAGSLMASMAIATAAQPRIKRSGPNPDSMEIDYSSTPGGTIDAPPGHDAEKLPLDALDPAQRELLDRHIAEIDRATVSKVLVTAEASAGETFAGYNLRVQTAIGSLMPYKELGERFYEQAYTNFLLWSHYTGADLEGYGDKRDNARHRIDSEDIDPDSIYMRVDLTPDVPVDRLQKIQGAIQMAQQLRVPTRYVLEELGVPDPDKMVRDYLKEQFVLAEHAGYVQRIQMEASGQLEMMAQQMAQGQMEQMQEQQAQDPAAMGGFGQEANPMDLLGGMGIGAAGQGVNPAAGGMPPAMLNPGGATREASTGRDATGMALA